MRNVTKAATNERAAIGSSIDATVGANITTVIETMTAIRKARATRSPFCLGLNWHLGHVVTLPSSSSCPHRLQLGCPSMNGSTPRFQVEPY